MAISPLEESHPSRCYRPGTLVLETRFENAGGAVVLTDAMGRRDGCSDLVRLIRGERGRMTIRTELIIRCEYGSIIPWVRRYRHQAWQAGFTLTRDYNGAVQEGVGYSQMTRNGRFRGSTARTFLAEAALNFPA